MDITQDDLLISKKTMVKAVESLKDSAPIGYIPVNFVSGDALGPAVLHFRNYTMEELLELSMTTDDKQYETLIVKCLSNMNYEKYDCTNLHLENILQVLLTIYLNFWNRFLYNQPYYIDLNGDLSSKENIARVDIDLSKIGFIPLDPSFKEPFTVTSKATGTRVGFRLARAKDILATNKYMKERYTEEDDKFKDLEQQLTLIQTLSQGDSLQVAEAERLNNSINKDDLADYLEYQKVKGKIEIMVLESQVIEFINDRKNLTLDEKIDAVLRNEVELVHWSGYKKAIRKYNEFGIDKNYTFRVGEEKLTRRFLFRYTKFIPSVDEDTDTGYDISFTD
jgi:hypothetical protein